MLKKIGLLVSTLLIALTIVACSNRKETDDKKGDNITVNLVDQIKFDNSYEDEMVDVPIDGPNMYQNTYMDVEPNFVFTLESHSTLLSDIEVSSSVVVEGCGGEPVNLNIHYKNDAEKILYDVSAEGGYEPGEAYTVTIPNNDSLLFEGKAPEIRKIIFTVKEEDKNILETINYTNYDLNKVSHFDGYETVEDAYLLYDGEISYNVGDIVTFSNDTDKIFIKIKGVTKENGLSKINYEIPAWDEIFEELDIHMDHKEINVEENFVLNDIEEIARQIKESPTALMYCYAVADKYNFLPSLDDFIDKVSINISFKPTGTSFTLGAEATYTHTDSQGWRTVLVLRFEWQKSFIASGDAEIDTVIGIPVGVKMNCSVATDERFTAQFCVTRKNKKFKSYNEDDTPQNLDMDRAREAVEDILENEDYTVLDDLGYKRDMVVGDTIMIDIGYLGFHFGWFSIDIDVYACMKFQTDITLGVKYTYSTHEVLVNYSSTKGNGDGGASPSEVSAKTLNFYLAGDLSIELFLKIRATAYITGLKFIANIGIDVDAGVYFELSGLATGGFNFTTKELDGNLGATIEAGLFFRVSLNVNLLWVVHMNWELYGVRFPMFKLGYIFDIRERATTDTIELSQLETDIANTNLLVFDALNGKSISIVVKQYKYNEEIVYFESSTGKGNASYRLFTEISSDNPDVTIKNGKICVREGIAETSGKITIKAKSNPFREKVYVAAFHYKSKDAKTVTFDGQNAKSYLPGQKIDFPTQVEKRTGYIFRGWALNGNQIDYKNGYTMPDDNVNFTAIYVEDRLYTINFYDAFNNLVYTTHARTFESAIAPDASIRDQHMDGYTFVAYDKSFDEITSDLEVHALYVRSGE